MAIAHTTDSIPLKLSHFAIVLAAGTSTRIGTCKTSLPWGDDQTLLTYKRIFLYLCSAIVLQSS
ncbi:hypothetical protein LC609_24980 [Nostoc sp. XA013]|nr:hypothetical protein [Nostoc sp. XA013]